MKNHSSKKKRAELVDKSLEIIYESLQSHLYWTHHKTSEGENFHKKCIQDYTKLMDMVSRLY